MHVVAESKNSAQVNVASNLSAQTIEVVVPTKIGGQNNTKMGIYVCLNMYGISESARRNGGCLTAVLGLAPMGSLADLLPS